MGRSVDLQRGGTRRSVRVWADLVAIGLEVDRSPIGPIQLARLRVETGGKFPPAVVPAGGRRLSAPTVSAPLATVRPVYGLGER